MPGIEIRPVALGQPDAPGINGGPVVAPVGSAPKHLVGQIRGAIVVHKRVAGPAALITLVRRDGVGVVPPVDQIQAGDLAPAETRAGTVIEIHEVIPPAGIRQGAIEKWSKDYEMQNYAIKRQTEVYRRVEVSTSVTGVPSAVFQEIKQGAIEKWPDDYEMEEYEMRNQTDAYRKLHP